MVAHSPARLTVRLALTLFAIYLLSFGGRIYSSDGWSMLAVTESFVKRGEFSTDQMWTLFQTKGLPGPDGEAFAKYGYGTSLLAVPLYTVARLLPQVGLAQTTVLTSAIALALAGALVLLAALRLGYAPAASTLIALLFGLATPAWVYAVEFWSEPFSLLTLLAAFYFLLCFQTTRAPRDALFAGFALGLAITVRLTNAALVPLFAWYGFAREWRTPPVRRGLIYFALPVCLLTLSVGAYNAVRFGNPLTSGYRLDEGFTNPLLLGLYGLLFSPGKGLFVYVPFLAVLPWVVVVYIRRAPRELVCLGGSALVYLVTFALWYYWWGGTDWGPRFLVPMLPFLVLLAAPAVELATFPPERPPLPSFVQGLVTQGRAILDENFDRARRYTHNAFTILFALLCLWSLGIELIGVSLPSLAYRLDLLASSFYPERDAIFSPADSPILGYLRILKPEWMDFAWLRVTGAAPQVDWLLLILLAAFAAFCAFMLARELNPGLTPPWARIPSSHSGHSEPERSGASAILIAPESRSTQEKGPFVAPPANGGPCHRGTALRVTNKVRYAPESAGWSLVLALLLVLFTLVRSHGDARFGGSTGYAQLLSRVAQEAGPRDVMILSDDAVAPFVMNESRAAFRWYGLARDPARMDETTQASGTTRALLRRLAQASGRIWYAVDASTEQLRDPVYEFLAANTHEVNSFDFDDGVSLILFEAVGAR